MALGGREYASWGAFLSVCAVTAREMRTAQRADKRDTARMMFSKLQMRAFYYAGNLISDGNGATQNSAWCRSEQNRSIAAPVLGIFAKGFSMPKPKSSATAVCCVC